MAQLLLVMRLLLWPLALLRIAVEGAAAGELGASKSKEINLVGQQKGDAERVLQSSGLPLTPGEEELRQFAERAPNGEGEIHVAPEQRPGYDELEVSGSSSQSVPIADAAADSSHIKRDAATFPAEPMALSEVPYQLFRSYVDEDFFSKWTFWTEADPSKGAVRYVGHEEAADKGLISASAGRVWLGVSQEVVPRGAGRPSVRIHSVDKFERGLFVIDVEHAPTDCGVWPAFWMYGNAWPSHGEFDIIEGVHAQERVLTSLHTTAECNQSRVQEGQDFSGRWQHGTRGQIADNCNVKAKDQWLNQGCPQEGPFGSLGYGFNSGGGGTFAAEWDPEVGHFRTWFWPQGDVPADLRVGMPEPSWWGAPYSYFGLTPEACTSDHFSNMSLVLNINFCGDMGKSTYRDSCPDLASGLTCRELVEERPETLGQSFWSIRSLDVYQRSMHRGEHLPRTWLRAVLGFVIVAVLLAAAVGTLHTIHVVKVIMGVPMFKDVPLADLGAGLGATSRGPRNIRSMPNYEQAPTSEVDECRAQSPHGSW